LIDVAKCRVERLVSYSEICAGVEALRLRPRHNQEGKGQALTQMSEIFHCRTYSLVHFWLHGSHILSYPGTVHTEIGHTVLGVGEHQGRRLVEVPNKFK
jgi:hypothetical protein